jgi:hypothetical protein
VIRLGLRIAHHVSSGLDDFGCRRDAYRRLVRSSFVLRTSLPDYLSGGD